MAIGLAPNARITRVGIGAYSASSLVCGLERFSAKSSHVSEWAAKNNLKTSEHHEGGTLALGNDVPAVLRDDLHALPEAVWESQRDRYVYETWVDRAKTAIASGAP